MDTRKRQGWLDYLKVAAAMAVVGLHVSVVPFSRYGDIPSTLWWASNLLNTACRWAVPVFVMISGALLLGRPIHTVPFYKKRLSTVLWPLLFWSVFYIGIRFFVRNEPVDEIVVSTLRGFPFYHLWYLFMLLGLIVFTPFINLLVTVQKLSLQDTVVLLPLVFFMLSIKWINAWFGVPYLSFAWLWVSFVGYFLFGYLLSRLPAEMVDGLKRKWLWLCLAASGSLIVFLNWHSFQIGFHAGVSHFWASPISPFVGLASLCVFVLFQKEDGRLRTGRISTSLANACLGVYLIHPFVLMVIHEVVDSLTYTSPVMMAIEYVLAVAVSFGAVLMMKKIPFLQRTV